MPTTTQTPAIRTARIGSLFSADKNTADLLSALLSEFEAILFVNGDFLSCDHKSRDRFAAIVGDAQDCFAEDGDTIADGKEDDAQWTLDAMMEAMNEFAPPYSYFGNSDAGYFGFWPNIEDAKDSCEFVSSRSHEYPDDDFEGEWLHINDHGNGTMYLREDGKDREIWSAV